MNAATWKVGALAEASGLTVRTLHHWDTIGLLCPSQRTAGGHREYTEDDAVRLYQVLALRNLGLGLESIGVCLDSGVDPARVVPSRRRTGRRTDADGHRPVRRAAGDRCRRRGSRPGAPPPSGARPAADPGDAGHRARLPGALPPGGGVARAVPAGGAPAHRRGRARRSAGAAAGGADGRAEHAVHRRRHGGVRRRPDGVA
ncbi:MULTISPECIES: MerR family transcriptional regulator [unclassified Streptomyces]|uniref:MerR family transcriptional regulator n=1 Tax=unclassified Streptomyces TaxID=2593676 RepID=UPI000D19D652|nr:MULTISPECIES: MerR family transcriptional regulator [unclassified Streptomyces]